MVQPDPNVIDAQAASEPRRRPTLPEPQPEGGTLPRSESLGARNIRRFPRRMFPARNLLTGLALVDVVAMVVSVTSFYYLLTSPALPGWISTEVADFRRLLPWQGALGWLMIYCALMLLFNHSAYFYEPVHHSSFTQEVASVTKAALAATLLLGVLVYLSAGISYPIIFGLAALVSTIALIAARGGRRSLREWRTKRGNGTRNVLIVGAGKVGQELAQHFERNKNLGLVVRGFIDENHHHDPRILGKAKDFVRVAQEEFVDDVIVTIPSERELVKYVAQHARERGITVKVVTEIFDGLGRQARMSYLDGFPVMELFGDPVPPFLHLVKRVFDIVVSAMVLIPLAPLLALIALLIRLDSPGPALYCAIRVGKKARRFVCYKFRTMVMNADEIKDSLRHLNERQGPTFKIAADPRMTRLGKFLRKYSFDELPQLWNVLKGDMSLVGPRPHPLDDFQQYSLEDLRRLQVKPGVTGLWQVSARQDPSFETNMRYDLQYIESWSLWLDLKILFKTIPVVFKGMGQ